MYRSSLPLLAIWAGLQGLLGSSYAGSLLNQLFEDSKECATLGKYKLYFTGATKVRDDAHHTLNYTLHYPRNLERQVCYVQAQMGCREMATELGAKQFSVQEGRVNRYTATAEWTCRMYTEDDPNPELFSTDDWSAMFVWGWTLQT